MTRMQILITAIAFLIFFIVWPVKVKADPPHPSKHYRWEAFSSGLVVLYFLEDGFYSRYVYQMVHAVEPATECVSVYGDRVFKLITRDTSYPYWYTLGADPVRQWDVKQKKYVKLK